MQVYVITAAYDPTVRASSREAAGDNLPAEHAPWRRDSPGNMITIDPSTDPIAEDIREKGYYLVHVW
jgi:hypothetical protein